LKIHNSNWRVVKPVTPDPVKKREAESSARIERLRSEKAGFERTIAELKQRRSARIERIQAEIAEVERRISKLNSILGIKNETKLEAANDRILYLPGNRVRSVPGEATVMDFEVTERTAALLNVYASLCFKDGCPPWLDLLHDYKTRCFEITHFKFEPEAGVYACGSYTTRGKRLRDQGRICGVSISTMICGANNDQPANLAFGQVKSSGADDTRHLERVRATPETLAVMGAVLIDGVTSALQPFVSNAEKWKQVLAQMAATQISPEQ
jgi:hypothetical protein